MLYEVITIRATAERFGLDTYPNQLEIITAEQMMDAYASVGMPVNYRHWSYGKEFIATEKNYRITSYNVCYTKLLRRTVGSDDTHNTALWEAEVEIFIKQLVAKAF